MKHDARITPEEPIDHRRNKARGQKRVASDPHFSRLRVGEKLDVLHAQLQLVEGYDAVLEQGATILRRLDALRAAVEEPHTDRLFQVRDRSGNGGLCRVQDRGRLAHAAGLHDAHQDVEVVQLHPASDAIAQLHLGIPHRTTAWLYS